MKIFGVDHCIDVCLKNKNEYVRLAVEDLVKDLSRVSSFDGKSEIVGEDKLCENAIIIEENTRPDLDPVEDESFSIRCDGKRITVSAPTYLGTMWGIYTFSEKVLGISPTYLWDDIEPLEADELWVEPFEITDSPKGFGFRGIFINDEDLLTGFKASGGKRYLDYPWYNETVDLSLIDRVVETALRLKINLVIPASFLDIDNPDEKAIADAVARRGIYLSQHHIEPVGLSTFGFDNYCKKYGKSGEFSYLKNPELMEEIWRFYAEKWAKYPNVVWQLGLRGKCDRPVWEEDIPTREELEGYGGFISRAIALQRSIVLQVSGGRAKHFTSTLWMEGAKLAKEGFLSLPDGVVAVFADNGPNQMYANDFYEVARESGREYGIYYHVQYFGLGPHLAPLTGLDKLHYNLKLAYDAGDRAYIILNSSNIREFTFELGAYSAMTWNMESFSKSDYLDSYAALFGDAKEEMKNAINDYFRALPTLHISLLSKHSGKFFDYRYEEVDGVKNLVLKDGMVVNSCRHILGKLKTDYFSDLWTAYDNAIAEATPHFETVKADFERIAMKNDSLKLAIEPHWLIYTELVLTLYNFHTSLLAAKKSSDLGENDGCRIHLTHAYEILKAHLVHRDVVQPADFAAWYKGDTKLHLPRLLREIEERLS